MATFKGNWLLACLFAASVLVVEAYAQDEAPPEGGAAAQASAEPVSDSSWVVAEPDGVSQAVIDPAMPASESASTIPVDEVRKVDGEIPAKQQAAGAAVQLDDVIVTATKRAQPLREIAASIDAFSGEKLENEGKINMADYLETKPGVTISAVAQNLLRISIRGISTDTAGGSGLPSPTGVFIGDTAFSDPYISNIQPDFNSFDLSSVEILKGPQGTLFGGQALAGAIRFVMQEPVLGTWQARGFTQYDTPAGGSPTMSSGIVVNAPLYRDELAVRLGYQRREYAAVYDNSREDVGREDVDGGLSNQYRALLTWRPTDALGIEYTHLSQDGFQADGVGFADSPDGPRENNKKILPQPSDTEFGLDSIEIGYDFDSMRAILLASRNHKSFEAYIDGTAGLYGTPPEGLPAIASGFTDIINISNGRSYELRLQAAEGEDLQWIGGLYYFDYDVLFDVLLDTILNQRLNGASGLPDDISRSDLTLLTSLTYGLADVTAYEKAAFFDVSYKFWDRLDLSIGARYYETQVKGGFYGTGLFVRTQTNGQDLDFSDNEITENGINPKFSAGFEITPDISVWAGASRGFRFGGLQSVPSPGPTNVQDPSSPNNVPEVYKSDTLWNYELGARTAWLDNTLHFDATLYYIDYQDPQLSQSTVGGVVNYGYTDNVSSARSRGFETSLAWLTPIEGLRLDLAGGMTDAVITEDFNAAGGMLIPAGSKLPGAADYQYSASLSYTAPQIGIFTMGGRVDYSYLGPTKADIRQTQDINDYGTLNAGLSVSTLAWRLKPRLSINISNVLDVVATKFSSSNSPATNTSFLPLPGGPLIGEPYTVYYLNAPRTISVRLGLEF